MKSFYIYSPNNIDANINHDISSLVFVKSGFSFGAFFFSHLWVLYHRMWFTFLFTILLQFLLRQTSLFLPAPLSLIIQGVLPFSLGFFWHSIRELHLFKKGYRLCGIIIASDIRNAQLRFVEKQMPYTEY